ncbi:MAG: hypothetical protein Q8N83_06335 [Ignavibacteria bacterium]|nr:hypothetical protein [Ignavibacteria bacterium]
MARIFFGQVSRNVRKESATSAKGKFVAYFAVRGELSEKKKMKQILHSRTMWFWLYQVRNYELG